MLQRLSHGPSYAQPPICSGEQINFMQLPLQSGLSYLLKSLGSCEPGATPTMYFTVNSAFQHFMSEFGLSHAHDPDGRLLSHEHVFDIFLNDTSKPSMHQNTLETILPLDPPDTLLELFQSISSRAHGSPNLPFFLLSGIPV